MKSPLLVFQSRESGFLSYRVPTNDVLDDTGTVPTTALEAPLLMSVDYAAPDVIAGFPFFTTVTFSTVSEATQYLIQRRLEGGDWVLMATVDTEEGATEISAQINAGLPFPAPPSSPASAFFRVIATDGSRNSVPSNVLFLSAYEPDESSVPVRDICSLGLDPASYDVVYRLSSYTPGASIQNADALPDLVAPEWDGTLAYTFFNEFSGVPRHWVSGEPNQWSINGGQFCRARCRYQCDFEGVPTWELILMDNNNGASIWAGHKIGGDLPSGIYTRIGGTENSPPAPAWFKVEAAEGTTSVAVGEDCSPTP